MTLEAGLLVGATVVAGVIGVLLANWYNRAKPWLGLSIIQRDDRNLVTIPEHLSEITMRCHWTEALETKAISLHKLIKFLNEAEEDTSFLRSSLDSITDFEKEHTIDFPDNRRNKSKLIKLLENRTFFSALIGMFRRDSLSLPKELQPASKVPILKGSDFTEKETPVFIIQTTSARLLLNPGRAPISADKIERTKILGKILQFWIEPYLSQIVAQVKDEMRSDLQDLLEIREQIHGIISSRKLLVGARIINSGGKPVHIKPFAVLQLRSGGKPVSPVVVVVESYRTYEAGIEDYDQMIGLLESIAEKQGVSAPRTPQGQKGIPEYVVVKPGEVVAVELVTEEPISDESIVASLENGMLSVRL